MDAYRRAIDLDERDAWSMNNLGLLLARDQAGRRGAAAADQRRGVAKGRPGVSQQPRHGARAHRAFQGRGDAYGDALTVDPRYEKAKQNLARVEAVKSGPDETFKAVDTTVIK